MLDDNKKSFRKMLKSNVFYVALGLCLLAAGVVGFSAADSKVPSATTDSTTKAKESVTYYVRMPDDEPTADEIEINIDEFTVPYTQEPSTEQVFDNSAEPLQESTTESREVLFYTPLSNGIAADYSMGYPVFSQTMKDYRTHNGVDFMGVKGESVRTVAEGTVVSVSKDELWGNTVTIDHGNGIVSSISGLADEALISEGSSVYSETVIGVVGDIPVEKEEPAHVHLEMRVNGALTDPLEILGLSENSAEG
ncbi:MAG: M23 family metallopeptidase [Clostridia bacterium]|nr:M23 family metallopeptidase [Clostridia bacterium]